MQKANLRSASETSLYAIDGIPFAKTFELYANDQPNLLIDRYETVVNPDFAQYLVLPTGLEAVEAAPPASPDVALQEIEEGVFLVGGSGTFVLFVEMDDYVVSVGGTAGVPERIAEFRKVVADKPIKYGVLTHHHNDHLLGVPAYEEQGSVILTVKEHEEVVRGSAQDGDALELKFVDESEWLHGGSRKIQIIDIGPTPHSEHLLVAWLPEEGILFEADHFPNPASGRMPPANARTRHLAEVIDEKGLDVRYIVGAHSARIASRADLVKALSLTPATAVSASW